ncbi:hypothetical protein AQUCO_04200168v1 [Aquilegia coerulea]|uniref:Uncharacterized protein n=1 Tax=Aquilegia coerulea TaxID=218851 RepID=A0A2G5CQV6_AQUCA|nr:hypothetical protein AQUCO_04200168v1 [Aquilegia coerulea]
MNQLPIRFCIVQKLCNFGQACFSSLTCILRRVNSGMVSSMAREKHGQEITKWIWSLLPAAAAFLWVIWKNRNDKAFKERETSTRKMEKEVKWVILIELLLGCNSISSEGIVSGVNQKGAGFGHEIFVCIVASSDVEKTMNILEYR